MAKFKIYSIIIVFLVLFNGLNYAHGYNIVGNFTNINNSVISYTEYSGRLLLVDATTAWCLGCDI